MLCWGHYIQFKLVDSSILHHFLLHSMKFKERTEKVLSKSTFIVVCMYKLHKTTMTNASTMQQNTHTPHIDRHTTRFKSHTIWNASHDEWGHEREERISFNYAIPFFLVFICRHCPRRSSFFSFFSCFLFSVSNLKGKLKHRHFYSKITTLVCYIIWVEYSVCSIYCICAMYIGTHFVCL